MLGGGGVEAISVQPQSRSHRVSYDPSTEGSLGGNRLFHPPSHRYLVRGTTRLQLAKSWNPGRSKGRLSRKDSRKLERIENKKRKVEHRTAKQCVQQKRPAQEEHKDIPVAKKPRVTTQPPEAKVSNPKPKQKTPLQKLVGNSSSYPGLPKTQAEDKEDPYIRYLEGRLGWKKNGARTSAYGSGLADDGLDGLCMPFCALSASSTKPPTHRITRWVGHV